MSPGSVWSVIRETPARSQTARYVRDHPGMTNKEISDALGRQSHRILRDLVSSGVLRKVRHGYYYHDHPIYIGGTDRASSVVATRAEEV